MRTSVLLKIIRVLVLLGGSAAAQAPVIERIEPPSWAGHWIGTVRVLGTGGKFRGSAVRSTSGSVKISSVRVNDRGDHLFFDVTISQRAKAGRYEFGVSNAAGRSGIPFDILPPLDPSTKTQGVNIDDIIYLIMTDPFADGDRSNNKHVVRKNPRAWHGGDLRGIVSKLDYLKELVEDPVESENSAYIFLPPGQFQNLRFSSPSK